VEIHEAARLLKYVEAMTLSDERQWQLQKRNPKSNCQIDDDRSTLLTFRDGDRLHRRDLVQTSIDAEGSGRNPNAVGELDACRYVAPDWGNIDGMLIPNDGVDKPVETAQTSPEHV